MIDFSFLGNSARAWITFGAIAVGGYLFLAALRSVLIMRLGALAKRTDTDIDDALVQVAATTTQPFLAAIALVVGSRWLEQIHPRLDLFLRRGLIVVILIQVGIWVAATVTFFVERSLSKRETADRIGVAAMRALGLGVKVVAWVVLAIIALNRVFDFDVTVLVTGLGVGGIALALAVQNILGDLLSALAIVFDRPFDVGDTIAVDQVVGRVENIGLKTTRIRSVNGEQVILSNGDLLKSRLRNYKRMYERRVVFFTDVTYDTPPELVEQIPSILREIIERRTPVRFDRSHFAVFAESALRFETAYYVLDPEYTTTMDVQQAVNVDILREFNGRGIRFAFPTRTMIPGGVTTEI